MKRTITVLVCLLFLASVLGMSAVVSAPKPDKPPKPPGGGGGNIPPGTLYFSYSDGSDYSIWTMKADGSEKTKTTLIDCAVEELSREMHGGHYWYIGFCDIVGETYPDGTPRHELFAISDDRTMSVQLTNDPYLEPRHWQGDPTEPFWGVHDVSVTWGAMKWVCDPDCVIDEAQAGYFDATIVYDGDGNIVDASTPSLIWWTELKLDPNGYWVPRTGSTNHWSPDGTKIVRYKWGVNVLDLVQGTETVLAEGWSPRWSPDGTKIVFRDAQDCLRTINPDGSNEQIIFVPKESNRGWYTVNAPRWSPDNSHISFGLYFFNNHMLTHKFWIYRVDVNGDRAQSMTNDLPADVVKLNVGWR